MTLVHKGTRISNIELLRIVSMIMVLNLHTFGGTEHGAGIIQAMDFFRHSASICAVNTFIIISGYFGIKWKVKSIFNLIFQILFYSFGVYVVCTLIGTIEYSNIDSLLSR